MSKRVFTDAERYAVYTVHGEKCYMCGKPVDLLSMEVDHVIPEWLLEEPEQRMDVLAKYGLPSDFDLQSFRNLLPACRPCNNRKRSRVFEPTTVAQLNLEIAEEKAEEATRLAKSTVKNQMLSRAFNTIRRAAAEGALDAEMEAALREFVMSHRGVRKPEMADSPIQLTPLLTVLSERGGIRIVKGPYGIGGGPIGGYAAEAARCPSCGNIAWNGVRCVACGNMNDD